MEQQQQQQLQQQLQEENQQEKSISKSFQNNNKNESFLSEFQNYLNDEDSLISENDDDDYNSDTIITKPQHLTTASTTSINFGEDFNLFTTTNGNMTSIKTSISDEEKDTSIHNLKGLNSTSYVTNENDFVNNEENYRGEKHGEDDEDHGNVDVSGDNFLEFDDDDEWNSFNDSIDIILHSKNYKGPLVQDDFDLQNVLNLSIIGEEEDEKEEDDSNSNDSNIVKEISSSFKNENEEQTSNTVTASHFFNDEYDDGSNADDGNSKSEKNSVDNNIVSRGEIIHLKDGNLSSYSSHNHTDFSMVESHGIENPKSISGHQSKIDENNHEIDDNDNNATSIEIEESSISDSVLPTFQSNTTTTTASIKNTISDFFNDFEHDKENEEEKIDDHSPKSIEENSTLRHSFSNSDEEKQSKDENLDQCYSDLENKSITQEYIPHEDSQINCSIASISSDKINSAQEYIATPPRPITLNEGISTVKAERILVNKSLSPYSTLAHLWLKQMKHGTSKGDESSESYDNISTLLSLENCPKVSAVVRVKRVLEDNSSKNGRKKSNFLLGLSPDDSYISSNYANTTTAAHCLFPMLDEDIENVDSSTRKEIILVNPDAFGNFVSTEVTIATARAVAELKSITSEDWVKCYKVDDVLWPEDIHLDNTTFIPIAQAMVNDSFVKQERNSVCLCTGGNSSGKKYSMLGRQWYVSTLNGNMRQSSDSDFDINFGIFGLIVKYALENYSSDDAGLCVSVLEIIHEDHIVDLLQNNSSLEEEQMPTIAKKHSKQNSNLRVREHKDGQGAFVPNLKQMIVRDMQDLFELYSFTSKTYHEKINEGKYIGGHILVSIKRPITSNEKISSSCAKEKTIQLVLLASASDLENDKDETQFSARKNGKRTNFRTPNSRTAISYKDDSQHLEQRAFIRKSVAAIGAMLRNILLHHKKNHHNALSLSFRESIMTRLLKRSLHPLESRAVVVTTCCPSRLAYAATLTALNFAHRLIRSASKATKAQSPFQPSSNRNRDSMGDTIEEASISSGISAASSLRRTMHLHSQEVLNKILSAQKNEETRKEIKKALLKTMLCDPRQRLSWGEDDNTFVSTSTTVRTFEREEQAGVWSGEEHEFLNKLQPISTDNEDDVSLLSSSPDKPYTFLSKNHIIKEHDTAALSDLPDRNVQTNNDFQRRNEHLPKQSIKDNSSTLDNYEPSILSDMAGDHQIDSFKSPLVRNTPISNNDCAESDVQDEEHPSLDSHEEAEDNKVLVDEETSQDEHKIAEMSNYPSSPYYETQQQFTPNSNDIDYSTHSIKDVDDSVSKEELKNMLSHLFDKVQRLELERDSLIGNIQSIEKHGQSRLVDKDVLENEKQKVQQLEHNCRVQQLDKATIEQENKELKENTVLLQNQLNSHDNTIQLLREENKFIDTSHRAIINELKETISQYENQLYDAEQESKALENKVDHLTMDKSRLRLQLFGLRLALKLKHNFSEDDTENDNYTLEDKSIQADFSVRQEYYDLINNNEYLLSFISSLSNRLHEKLNYFLEVNKLNDNPERLAESCKSILVEMACSLLCEDTFGNETLNARQDIAVIDSKQHDKSPNYLQARIHELGIKLSSQLDIMRIFDETLMHCFSYFVTRNKIPESKSEESLLKHVYYESYFSLLKEDRKENSTEFRKHFYFYSSMINGTNGLCKDIDLEKNQLLQNDNNNWVIEKRNELIESAKEELLSTQKMQQELEWNVQVCEAKLSAEKDLRKQQEIDFMRQISMLEKQEKELRTQQSFELKSTNDHLLQKIVSLENELSSHQESISYLQNNLQVEKSFREQLLVEQELRRNQETEMSKLTSINENNEEEMNIKIKSFENDVVYFKETINSLQQDLQISDNAKKEMESVQAKTKAELDEARQQKLQIEQSAYKSIAMWEENVTRLRDEVGQSRKELTAEKLYFLNSKTLNDKLKAQNDRDTRDIDSLQSATLAKEEVLGTLRQKIALLESQLLTTQNKEKRLQNEIEIFINQNEEQISVYDKIKEELEDKTSLLYCLEQQLQKCKEDNETLMIQKTQDGINKDYVEKMKLERDHARYNEKQFQTELESVKAKLELTQFTGDAE